MGRPPLFLIVRSGAGTSPRRSIALSVAMPLSLGSNIAEPRPDVAIPQERSFTSWLDRLESKRGRSWYKREDQLHIGPMKSKMSPAGKEFWWCQMVMMAPKTARPATKQRNKEQGHKRLRSSFVETSTSSEANPSFCLWHFFIAVINSVKQKSLKRSIKILDSFQ